MLKCFNLLHTTLYTIILKLNNGDFMNDDELMNGVDCIKKMIEIYRQSKEEKIFAEYFLNMQKENKKLKVIGHVKDINSKFKNEFFEDIYEDENGVIYDIRIFETTPPQSVTDDLTEYWLTLECTFNKPVEPIYIILGDR